MERLILSTPTLALLASFALAASPAVAQAAGPSAGQQASVVPGTARDLFEPGPIELARPPQCVPGEQKFSATVPLVPKGATCEVICTTYCQDNGGYLLTWSENFGELSCNCTCCR